MTQPKLSYLNLYTTDPAWNLAAEQYVFDALPRDRTYFMLWQNDNAIIIGKHQNAAAEINQQFVRENGVRVVRRLSGGGAVCHDMGNLNFTFIADAGDMESINFKLFCQPVVAALAALGVTAEVNGRNDMTIDRQKFSGNSQYLKEGRVMHHGTSCSTPIWTGWRRPSMWTRGRSPPRAWPPSGAASPPCGSTCPIP